MKIRDLVKNLLSLIYALIIKVRCAVKRYAMCTSFYALCVIGLFSLIFFNMNVLLSWMTILIISEDITSVGSYELFLVLLSFTFCISAMPKLSKYAKKYLMNEEPRIHIRWSEFWKDVKKEFPDYFLSGAWLILFFLASFAWAITYVMTCIWNLLTKKDMDAYKSRTWIVLTTIVEYAGAAKATKV